MSDPLRVRTMTEAEVEELVRWAAVEGWNPGLHDAGAFWRTDPEGFLALDTGPDLIGAGAVVRHNARFGFMGLFIVRPEFRGRGLGSRLWHLRRDHLLARLDPGGVLGMDAVEAMMPFYTRGGFHPVTGHRRYRLDAPPPGLLADPEVIDLAQVPRNDVLAFDHDCFPGPREAFLRQWLALPDSHALGLMFEGRLAAYGVIRRCGVGWKVGPLLAEHDALAGRLFAALVHRAAEGPFFVDVPENNPAALALVESLKMPTVFRCVRMYHGPAPRLRDERIFGIATLELG
ncbi:MAG: GNAT family N-acetyltransferase [Gemmataceae bacterium]